MPSNLPFSKVMDQLLHGDSDAAREVFDRYARRLVALAAARLPAFTRPKLDPEDVAQSVFRTFFRRHGDGEFHPDHWDALWSLLAVLAARKCGHRVEHLLAAKRDIRRESTPRSPVAQSSGESSMEWVPIDPSPTAEEAAMLEETVRQLLSNLTDRERTVVLLRLEGHSIIEVAERAAASERSVHRILANLRSRLQVQAGE